MSGMDGKGRFERAVILLLLIVLLKRSMTCEGQTVLTINYTHTYIRTCRTSDNTNGRRTTIAYR